MTKYDKKDIQNLNKSFRTNLINSILGPKPVNLIGTKSKDGIENLAIFSSLVHLGADPALIGFIQRPITDFSHTYKNILETNYYTINQINTKIYKNAHITSARVERELSEFNISNLRASYEQDFFAPFVLESHVKIGLIFREAIPIKWNNTHLIIGEIESLIFDKNCIETNGEVNPLTNDIALVSGLETYYSSQFLEKLAYVKAKDIQA